MEVSIVTVCCFIALLKTIRGLTLRFHVVLADSANRESLVIARRRSRRGNPDGLNKIHLCLAGLLHFIRNDGKGVMNYGSINNRDLS